LPSSPFGVAALLYGKRALVKPKWGGW